MDKNHERGEEWFPDYMVLGPGGIRGLYYIGALQKLKVKNRLSYVRGWGATSVGAPVSLMMIIGYTPMEIMTVGVGTSLFSDFFSVKLGDRMREMRENMGIISNNDIRRQMEDIVTSKMNFIPTLKQLYDIKKVDFRVATYNVTDQRLEILSHETEPDMSCVIAVMLAINIPFLFYQITYNGKTYIDAAFVCPLVIFPFDDGHNKIMTIFVDIQNRDTEELGFTTYIHRIFTSTIKRLRDLTIANSSQNCRHLCIISPFQDITGAGIDSKDKGWMVVSGIDAVDRFISQVDDPRDKYLHITSGMNENDRVNCVFRRIISSYHTSDVKTIISP